MSLANEAAHAQRQRDKRQPNFQTAIHFFLRLVLGCLLMFLFRGEKLRLVFRWVLAFFLPFDCLVLTIRKSASFFCGFFEQCLAGVEPDPVGHQIVFGFTAVKLVDVGPKIDVIERGRHADERVIAGRAVVTQRPGRIAPTPAIGQQNQKVFLTPMTNRRRCG